MTLAQNSGADGTKVLNQLRQKHAAAGPEGRWWGVDCMNCTVALALFVTATTTVEHSRTICHLAVESCELL